MQTKEQIEDWYKIPDRWQYFQSKEDAIRKGKLLSMLPKTYVNALDIGAGECFIAQSLPADNIFGIEWSDTAATRFPENVTRIHQPSCDTNYDLVVTTGTLYPQYDHKLIYGWILEAASEHILVAGIKEWLIDYPFDKWCKVLNRVEFSYMNFTQVATLYEINK